MGKLEQQILEAAQEGTSESNFSLGAQLKNKLTSGEVDPALVTEEIKQLMGGKPQEESTAGVTEEESAQSKPSMAKQGRNRGGRGSIGEPTEIRQSIEEARREGVRIDHDLAKLKNDKEALLFTLADLRVRERQMVEKKLTYETNAFRKEIAKAQKKIDEINGVLPETNVSDDHRKVQRIINEWNAGKRDWRNERARFQKAEKKLEKNPNDRRAQGEANRARVEMQTTDENLDRVAREAEVIAENKTATHIEDEGVFYTHEQAEADRKDWEERHKMSQEEAVLEAVPVPENFTEHALQEEEAKTLAPELNPEQADLIKRFENNIAGIEDQIKERAERTGAVDAIRKVGEAYNKIPHHYKWLLAGGLFVSGAGAVALGATFAAGATGAVAALMRGLGGAGLFVTFEKILKNAEEKKTGAPRGWGAELRHTVEASALAIAIGALLPNVLHDTFLDSDISQTVHEYFGSTADVAPRTEQVVAETPVAPPNEYIGVAEAGDSRWSLAERALAEGPYKDQFNAIASAEQRTYIIDALKDKITAGMTAEEANTLNVGDKIDFKEFFEDKSFMDKAFSGAQNLTPEEITNIQNYSGETGASEAILTPVEQELRTTFDSNEQEMPAVSGEAVSITPEIALANTSPETNVIPQEILPDTSQGVLLGEYETTVNPQAIAHAEKQVHDIIQNMWGKKGGWFGIGSTDGTEIFRGFSDKTVEEVMKMDATGKNLEAQYLLGQAYEQTHVKSAQGEKVVDYLHRATAVGIDRFMKNE